MWPHFVRTSLPRSSGIIPGDFGRWLWGYCCSLVSAVSQTRHHPHSTPHCDLSLHLLQPSSTSSSCTRLCGGPCRRTPMSSSPSLRPPSSSSYSTTSADFRGRPRCSPGSGYNAPLHPLHHPAEGRHRHLRQQESHHLPLRQQERFHRPLHQQERRHHPLHQQERLLRPLHQQESRHHCPVSAIVQHGTNLSEFSLLCQAQLVYILKC